MLSFKRAFSLSPFTFIKWLFSASSLSAIRVVSSAYLRLLMFLPAILSPACASSSLACWWPGCSPPGPSAYGNSPGKNTGVGCHALLQEIFPTQGLNPDLLHCRQILYHFSHQGSPGILQWVAYPFSRGSSQPSDRTWVSHISSSVFTS